MTQQVTAGDVDAIRKRVQSSAEISGIYSDLLTLLAYIDQMQAPPVGLDPTGGAEPIP
jgi:hypothetical protein